MSKKKARKKKATEVTETSEKTQKRQFWILNGNEHDQTALVNCLRHGARAASTSFICFSSPCSPYPYGHNASVVNPLKFFLLFFLDNLCVLCGYLKQKPAVNCGGKSCKE